MTRGKHARNINLPGASEDEIVMFRANLNYIIRVNVYGWCWWLQEAVQKSWKISTGFYFTICF